MKFFCMQCPVCEALNREYSLMCEVEATLVLRERYAMLRPCPDVQQAGVEDAREMVLLSKKRQASIRSCLESHKAKVHSA